MLHFAPVVSLPRGRITRPPPRPGPTTLSPRPPKPLSPSGIVGGGGRARRTSGCRIGGFGAGLAMFLKQQAGLSSAKLLDPRSFEKQHFTTKAQELGNEVAETASWHITGPGPCIAGTQPLNIQQSSEHDQSGTVLIFDIETTGFLHKGHRIIEFALRDLSGGKNSTFETLINPERTVPKYAATVNNIDTVLVCRPDIPRFSDVIPLLLAFVRSRQAPGKPILWVAHNAKNFDAPFLAQEFDRCSAPIPADWLFVDTLCLARRLVKADDASFNFRIINSLTAMLSFSQDNKSDSVGMLCMIS
ncbi:hypothetical protein ABZP36_003494 [Zizania latifolia]